MIQASAITQTRIVGVTCPVLSILDVSLGIGKLVVSSEKINQFGKYGVLIRLFFKHFLELFHGFVVLIIFEKYLCENRTGLVVFGVYFEQDAAEILAFLEMVFFHLDIS